MQNPKWTISEAGLRPSAYKNCWRNLRLFTFFGRASSEVRNGRNGCVFARNSSAEWNIQVAGNTGSCESGTNL